MAAKVELYCRHDRVCLEMNNQEMEENRVVQQIITITTTSRETLVDITHEVEQAVEGSGLVNGIVSIYA